MRIRPRFVVAAVVVAVLFVAGWLGVRGASAHRHLVQARAELAAARTALLDRDLTEAERRVQAAGRETSQARRTTSDVVWRAVSAVPFAGASLAEAAQVAQVADDVARGVLPAALDAARTLDPKKLRAPDGTIDVALLHRAMPDIAQADTRATAALAALSPHERRGVVGPVRRAARDLRAQAETLARTLHGAREGIELAPALLGTDRTRRYFVLIQQNSESRGTGGLPGGFAILTATNGRLRVTAQGSNADLKSGPLPPPPGVPHDFIARYAGDGAFDLWVNVNLSPDLPVVARVIADRWRHQSGQSIDGVVTVDSQALADILRGSPPIAVAGAKPLTPANIVDYLAVGQYRDFAAPASSGGIDRSAERKQLLVTIARAATDRLVGGGGSTLELLRGLADAVSSGHLRMASDDPALRPQLHQAGIDGALPDGPAPVAYPVLFNSSGGKLDYFVDRSVTYEAGACTGRRRRSTITFELSNSAPPGLPPYLTNPAHMPGLDSTTARVTVMIYGTRGARLVSATLDGKPLGSALNGAVEAGLPQWSTLLNLPSGQPRRIVLHLDEPTSAGPARVPVQPLARPLSVRTSVPEC